MADKNIYYLHELSDYKIASDYPDVRGWQVKDADNNTIGKVDNLLVNKKTERVVYLDVEVDESILKKDTETLTASASEGVHGFINKDGEDHLIIPIGLADLNEDQNLVLCNNIGHQTFRQTKRIRKGSNIEQNFELMIYKHYVPDRHQNEKMDVDDSFYNQKAFRKDV